MATPKYAERTEVPSDRSRAEIESCLRRYGAVAFGYSWDADAAVIAFQISMRRIRFTLPLPDPTSREFTHTAARGYRREPAAQAAEYERAVRQRWRALALVIKAKLEAVAAGISTIEAEFLAAVVLPDGNTVGDWVQPQLTAAVERGEMPAALTASDGAKA